MASVLFVHLGTALPPWLSVALRQAACFAPRAVVLVADAQALAAAGTAKIPGVTQVALQDIGRSRKHAAFAALSPLDRSFRDGFWTYTSERFFVIESVMRELRLSEVIHLENDVMLYCDVATLAPRLADLYPQVATTFDNDERCVPAVVYLRDAGAAAAITDFFLAVFMQLRRQGGPVPAVNDMAILGALRRHRPDVVEHLPIVPPDYPAPLRSPAGHVPADPSLYSQHYAALGWLFDAAAIGQYLGGVDERNTSVPTIGFLNESCVFDARRLEPGFETDEQGRRVPVLRSPSGMHRLANLHVHSKRLEPFASA